jgi:hypothetical protein
MPEPAPERTPPAITAITPPAEVAVQVREGHTVGYDPPPCLPWVKRWTCTTCGDPVVVSGRRIYGSAITRTCAESVKKWAGR